MISTQNFNLLPDRQSLRRICKAISVLDAIISPEWEYRYHSFNAEWTEGEEFFEIRNGQGNHLLVLFREDGCVISGFAPDYHQPDKKHLTANMPLIFSEFIFGEPVSTIGTTFCLWSAGTEKWQTGKIKNHENGSEEMLGIFDGNPQTYIEWASEYFEDDYVNSELSFDTVRKIYNGEVLTKNMVLYTVVEFEGWSKLQEDLEEIGYPYNFT
jgi:hypothetical protein